MTTWYDPDEIKHQADNAKVQPEFDPLDLGDEEIRIVDDVSEEGYEHADELKEDADWMRELISTFTQDHDPLA